MTTTRRETVAYALTGCLAIVIAIGAFSPPPEVPGPPNNDKLLHAIAFAALILPTAALIPRHLGWMVALAVGYGIAIELIQPLVDRSREFLDLVADCGGLAVGVVIGLLLHKLIRR